MSEDPAREPVVAPAVSAPSVPGTAAPPPPAAVAPPSAQTLAAPAPLTTTGVVLSVFCTVLWGGVSVASQIATDSIPPMLLATFRFLLAAVFMYGWCRWEGTSIRIRPGQWRPVIVMSLYMFFQIGTFQLGTAWSTTSHSTLLVNTYVFWVAAIETWVLKTFRLSVRQTIGLFVAAAGVVLLMATDRRAGAASLDEPTVLGDVVLAVSGLLFGLMTIATRPALRAIEAGPLILWRNFFAAIAMGAVSFATEDYGPIRWDTRTVSAVFYAGLVVSGICFSLQVWLLRRFSASQVSVFSFATPIFGVALGVLIRGDVLSPWLFLSGICVALGIALVNAPVRKTAAK